MQTNYLTTCLDSQEFCHGFGVFIKGLHVTQDIKVEEAERARGPERLPVAVQLEDSSFLIRHMLHDVFQKLGRRGLVVGRPTEV